MSEAEKQIDAATVDDSFFRRLIEQTGVAVVATNQHLRINAWNAAAERMFGAARDKMIGEPITTIIPSQQHGLAERLFRRAIAQGESSNLEFQFPTSAGARRELILTLSPVASSTGERVGASAMIRDITKRIHLQEEVLESRKMAALGEMAGAVAHYFNNTLGGIVTSVDFARASENPQLKARTLDQISLALVRMTPLLQGLLSFAEGDQRADDLSDYTELVLAVADELEAQAKARDIELVIEVSDVGVHALPRARTRTILRHVVQNAIDAMPEGGRLTINGSVQGPMIVTRISDTGVGLEPADLLRVFEPFWSRKPALPGEVSRAPGLGLAIVHGIVQMMGGTISATSRPGEGSCFSIRLPKSTPE